jgi:ADP-ribosyl-[dinitrogen reductase] hydrolase
MTMKLTSIQLDRAAGAVLGSAVGDALGAPYEFHPPVATDVEIIMSGGGGWETGEWTDDTSMAIPILQVVARGDRLEGSALDEMIAAWAGWARGAKDVGIQTSQVLHGLRALTAAEALESSRRVHEASGRSGGNGSLMRTGPVALGYLDDLPGLIIAARAVSDLTHFEQDAGDACVIWSVAIRHAVLTGEADVRVGIASLPAERQTRWIALVAEAEAKQPAEIANNGWVVAAFQAAWSAISHGEGFADAVDRAVRAGYDTDTVAAIAGSLIGAATGASAIPAIWRRPLHGWPGMTSRDLTELAVLAARAGEPDKDGWPSGQRFQPSAIDTLVAHPHDPDVLLASLAGLDRLPADVDAVVSLCRIGSQQTDREHIEFWLVDQDGANPHLDLVLADAVATVAALRAEGKRVAIHCFEARSRTSAVAVLYSTRELGIPLDATVADVAGALPDWEPAPFLRDAMTRLTVSRAEARRG